VTAIESATDSNSELPAQRSRAGSPIAALALLMAVFGCLLGSADIHRWLELYHELNAPGSWWFVGLTIGAGVVGGAIGIIGIFLSRSSWRMRLLALPAGILAGEIGLFMLLATGPIWRSLFAIAVMLVAALIFRLDAD
jgi:hypothetical protein